MKLRYNFDELKDRTYEELEGVGIDYILNTCNYSNTYDENLFLDNIENEIFYDDNLLNKISFNI